MVLFSMIHPLDQCVPISPICWAVGGAQVLERLDEHLERRFFRRSQAATPSSSPRVLARHCWTSTKCSFPLMW